MISIRQKVQNMLTLFTLQQTRNSSWKKEPVGLEDPGGEPGRSTREENPGGELGRRTREENQGGELSTADNTERIRFSIRHS